MKRFKRFSVGMLISVIILSATAGALWLSGWNLSGSMTATTGSEQAVVMETWNVNITSEGNVTNQIAYFNENGVITWEFSTDLSGVSSSDPKCNFEENEDLIFYVNGQRISETTSANITIIDGSNQINITVDPSVFRCPLTGSYEINAIIV